MTKKSVGTSSQTHTWYRFDDADELCWGIEGEIAPALATPLAPAALFASILLLGAAVGAIGVIATGCGD